MGVKWGLHPISAAAGKDENPGEASVEADRIAAGAFAATTI
jgi:hypothetical protein